MISLDSILATVKKQLGITGEYDIFDADLIIHINSVLMILYQLGVGSSPMTIDGYDQTWDSLFGDRNDLAMIKTYIGHKFRLVFDSPTSSYTMDACQNAINELEWRINVQVDPSKEDSYE